MTIYSGWGLIGPPPPGQLEQEFIADAEDAAALAWKRFLQRQERHDRLAQAPGPETWSPAGSAWSGVPGPRRRR